MTEIQKLLIELQEKGWPQWAIAEELGVVPDVVWRWRAGRVQPSSSRAVLRTLQQLLTRKRIPKKRRWKKQPAQ